jgi:hypothetical protein
MRDARVTTTFAAIQRQWWIRHFRILVTHEASSSFNGEGLSELFIALYGTGLRSKLVGQLVIELTFLTDQHYFAVGNWIQFLPWLGARILTN